MRQKFIFLFLVFVFLLSCQIGLGDQYATTEDGKKVLLKDNGLWEYVISPNKGGSLEETLKRFGIPYNVYQEINESGKRSYTILNRAQMDPKTYKGEIILLKHDYSPNYGYTDVGFIKKIQKEGYVYYIDTDMGERIQGLYIGALWICSPSDWGDDFYVRFCCNYCPPDWIEGAKVDVIARIVGIDKNSDYITIQPILVRGVDEIGTSIWYSAETGEKVSLGK